MVPSSRSSLNLSSWSTARALFPALTCACCAASATHFVSAFAFHIARFFATTPCILDLVCFTSPADFAGWGSFPARVERCGSLLAG